MIAALVVSIACGKTYGEDEGAEAAPDAGLDGRVSDATSDSPSPSPSPAPLDAGLEAEAPRFCADGGLCEDFEGASVAGSFERFPADTTAATIGTTDERGSSSSKSLHATTNGGAGPAGIKALWRWNLGLTPPFRQLTISFDIFIAAHPEPSTLASFVVFDALEVQIDAHPQSSNVALEIYTIDRRKEPVGLASSPRIDCPIGEWVPLRIILSEKGTQSRLELGAGAVELLTLPLPTFVAGGQIALGVNAGTGGSHDSIFYDNVRVVRSQ